MSACALHIYEIQSYLAEPSWWSVYYAYVRAYIGTCRRNARPAPAYVSVQPHASNGGRINYGMLSDICAATERPGGSSGGSGMHPRSNINIMAAPRTVVQWRPGRMNNACAVTLSVTTESD